MLIYNLALNKYDSFFIHNRSLGTKSTKNLSLTSLKNTHIPNIRNYATLRGQYKDFFIIYQSFIDWSANNKPEKHTIKDWIDYPFSLEVFQEHAKEKPYLLNKLCSPYQFSKESLEQEIITPRKKILFVYVIDAYYSSFRELFKLSYENLSQDFTDYLNYVIECKPLKKNNIFSLVIEDWEDLTKHPSKEELREFKELYSSILFKSPVPSYSNGYGVAGANEVPLGESCEHYYDHLYNKLDICEIRKYLELYLKELRSTNPEKEFYYLLLPHRIPFHHVITNSIFDKDVSVISCELQNLQESLYYHSLRSSREITFENKIIQSSEHMIKCIKNNLDKFLAQDFSNYRPKLFIILASEARADMEIYLSDVYRNPAPYQEFRFQFLEYLDSVINKKSLSLLNTFAEVTHYENEKLNFDQWFEKHYLKSRHSSWVLWDKEEKNKFKLENCEELEKEYPLFCLFDKAEKERTQLINHYMEKLQKVLPEKVINYIVIPYTTLHQEYYMIL